MHRSILFLRDVETFQARWRDAWWFWLGLTLLIAVRLAHFGPELDEPHQWRQADTANYVWDYYQNGIDLLHPSVCWMGGQKTVALEFPLPEAIAAVAHTILGPNLGWSRAVFFLFYLGAAWYFYRILAFLGDRTLARAAVLVYLMLPLGIFYSRSIHIDFSVVFFAHAMCYHFLVAMRRESMLHFGLALTSMTIGFLVKAPYLFYFCIPLAAFLTRERKWWYFLRHSFWLIIPIVAFVAWQMHVRAVNAAMPDWSFIPDYHKMDNQLGWYFGRWADRTRPGVWDLLFDRLKYPLTAVLGLPLMIVGLFVGLRSFVANFIRWWLLGTLVYLIVFFPLIEKHDYYQIPFLAPIAFLIVLPLHAGKNWLARFNPDITKAGFVVALAVLGWYSVGMTEGKYGDFRAKMAFESYYQIDQAVVEAGKSIQQITPAGSLVAITYQGYDCRCPTMLFSARRNGWSIAEQHVNPDLLQKLVEIGATHYAILQREPLTPETENFLHQFRAWKIPLSDQHTVLQIFEMKNDRSNR